MTRLGVLTLDTALIVRTWDGWIAEATGVPSSEACGRRLVDVVPSLADRGLLPRFEQVLATGEVQVLAPAFHHYLLPCPPREASARFEQMQQHVTLGPLRDGDRIVGVMATIEDVTARIDEERELAGTLREEDWRTRRAFVEQMARTADRDVVTALVASLRTEHRDFNVLSSALKLLSMTDVDVTGQLAELLHDPDADLRLQAALALGEHQSADAIGPLLRALDDPDTNVRYHAIEALGRLRAADAVEPLADIAASGDFFLAFPAIDALARINDPRVSSRLVPLLARSEVAEAAADALSELGGPEVVHPLVAGLNGAGPVMPAARALARVHERFDGQYGDGTVIVDGFRAAIGPSGSQRILDAVADAPTADLRSLVRVLGWLRGPAVERALARLLGTPTVRSDVIEAIVRQGAGIADSLIEQLHVSDAETRLAAIVALGRLGSQRAAQAVAAMLDGEPDEIIAAAATLARIGDPAAYESLMPLLAHEDAAVRQAAIGALNALGHPDMKREVVALLDSADPRVRESAVRVAGYFGYREAVDPLLLRCDDPVEAVRRAAVEHLPFLEDSRACERLSGALSDASPKVRAAAAQALGRVTPFDARSAWLLTATADQDPWVRYYAARSLADTADPATLPRLVELGASDPAIHVRIAALEALGAIGGPEAIDVLLATAADGHVELAGAALRALGRAVDPRAEHALRNALRSDDVALRLAAVTGLRTGGSAEAIQSLAWAAAADADDAVARGAVDALGELARRPNSLGAAAADALLTIAAEPRLRDAAVAALAALPDVRIPSVAGGLEHARPDVRRAAVGVLGRMKHPDASAAIQRALDDEDGTVREAAITALERLGTRGIARKLDAMAQSDPSRAVRRAASAALGRVDDRPR